MQTRIFSRSRSWTFFGVFAQENRVNRKKFWDSGNLGAFLRIHSTFTANIDFPKIRRAMFFDLFQKNIQCKHKTILSKVYFLENMCRTADFHFEHDRWE